MDGDEFRARGHELIDWIAEYLESLEERRVAPDVAPGDLRAMLPAHPPDGPEPWSAVLADLDRVIAPGIVHWQHPSFFAYFPGNTSYPSILGDLLAAGLGVQGMSWVTSPACTELESLMLDWMVELLDLPPTFRTDAATGGGVIQGSGGGVIQGWGGGVIQGWGGGVIQGSASEATLVAILAARWRATGGDVNHDGSTQRLVAYATSQAHSSVEKGLRIAGIGTDRLRIVAHDTSFAMRADALAELIEADQANDLVPCFVCSTHGTTSSMAFDPTAELAPICATAGAWLHVDAAMSGIAALAPEHRWVNDGLEGVDSYCTNPHKWMGVNFDCDLLWTRDRRAVLGALSILPEYLRSAAADAGAAIDYRDWQVPLGRRFRALKLWLALRLDGVGAMQEMIRRHVDMTQRLAALVAADERFEIVAPYPLNLVCLRLRDGDTDALIERANATGQALFTRTVLDAQVALRFSIGTKTTEWHHVESAWNLLRSLA